MIGRLRFEIDTEPESTYQIERVPDTPVSISPQVGEHNWPNLGTLDTDKIDPVALGSYCSPMRERSGHLHIDTLWRLALVPVLTHVQGTSFV